MTIKSKAQFAGTIENRGWFLFIFYLPIEQINPIPADQWLQISNQTICCNSQHVLIETDFRPVQLDIWSDPLYSTFTTYFTSFNSV